MLLYTTITVRSERDSVLGILVDWVVQKAIPYSSPQPTFNAGRHAVVADRDVCFSPTTVPNPVLGTVYPAFTEGPIAHTAEVPQTAQRNASKAENHARSTGATLDSIFVLLESSPGIS